MGRVYTSLPVVISSPLLISHRTLCWRASVATRPVFLNITVQGLKKHSISRVLIVSGYGLSLLLFIPFLCCLLISVEDAAEAQSPWRPRSLTVISTCWYRRLTMHSDRLRRRQHRPWSSSDHQETCGWTMCPSREHDGCRALQEF